MNFASILFAAALLTGIMPAYADPNAAALDAAPVLKVMRAEISAKPSRVLITVEDALTMNEQAACEIVKEAIKSTRADAKLTGEIVFTALSHSPAMSAVIVECAVAASPHAVEDIKKAMEKALGTRAGSAMTGLTEGSGQAPAEETTGNESNGSGKETSGEPSGKGALTALPPDIEEDFDLTFVGVGGIYLLVPGRSYFRCDPYDPCCTGDLTQACLQP